MTQRNHDLRRAQLLDAGWETLSALRTLSALSADLIGQIPRSGSDSGSLETVRAVQALAQATLERTGRLIHLLGALSVALESGDQRSGE